MKRQSEARFGMALRQVQLQGMVWKPADDMRNWKPCDYIAWWRCGHGAGSYVKTFWFEVKDTPAKTSFPKRDLRPSQREAARKAGELGIPYYLAIYWRELQMWTISDAVAVLEWLDSAPDSRSVPREMLMSRFGIDSSTANLAATIKGVAIDGL